jgi:3',5'-cyclic AMP phosphodiesterase CpdA
MNCMTTRIAQISDTHLSSTKAIFRPNFDVVAEHLSCSEPDLIVNTGDLSLDGADNEEDLLEAVAVHRQLPVECRLLPGNHDVGDHIEVARKQPVTAERLDRYRRVVGADWWTIDIPGWRLLGLNALIVGSGLSGDAEQLDMVRGAAAGLKGRALAIFLHKPLADETYTENLSINRFMTHHPRSALLAALGGTAPAVVLSGHVHQYRDSFIGGSRHIWAPATSFMISDPWQPGYGAKAVGYLFHEFDADGGHRHRLVGVRGLIHHDLVEFPEAYGDVRAWGPGNA